MSTELIDAAHIARDAKLVRMAVTRGWDVPEEYLATIPKAMGEIVVSEDQKPQDRIAAAKVLVAMKSRNDLKQPRRQTLKRPSAADIGAGIGIGLGLGMPGGGTLDAKLGEAAQRIARLFGIGEIIEIGRGSGQAAQPDRGPRIATDG